MRLRKGSGDRRSEGPGTPKADRMCEGKGIEFGSKLCVCPNCDHRMMHPERGSPCAETKCPQCGSAMSGVPCLENGDAGSARMMKFKCSDCGLLMVLPKKPANCFTCGGSHIDRYGWRDDKESIERE